ncbi:MAG: sensor histidine kinase [Oscillospiraceae bacterium]|nr:sensor histidine kinase [Oscillospiraceae bacterium]
MNRENRINRVFKSKSVGFIIITACVLIILMLMASLLIATFSSFKTGINGAVHTQTRELSTQIVYNYENYIGSIIATSNTIQTDIDRFDISTEHGGRLLSDFLGDIIHLKSDIIKIAIYDYETGLCLASSSEREIGMEIDVQDVNWFTEAISDPTVHVFSIPYAEFGSEEYKVNVSKRIRFQNGVRVGVLKIEISFQSFIDLVDKSNLGQGGHITIIDSNYNIVYSSLRGSAQEEIGSQAQSLVQESIDVAREIVLGVKNAVLNGYNMAVNVDTLSNTKWRICVFINIDKLVEIEQTFLFTTFLVSSIVLVIGILLFTVVARAITSPMKQLELAMRKVEKSDYFRMEEVEIAASREVEALTRRFNRMIRKIGELMDHVITEQNAQRKSELKALQNQINPHFLYNTLDSIMWLIENNKNIEASEMVVALATLFRIGISNDSEVIPVRDEIEHVRNYLLIQNNRYSGSFDYEFDVDPASLNVKTMKLVLQPIVENCIYHGLKNKIDKGFIKIDVFIENDFLSLRVSDNGYGMRQETIDALYRSFEDGVVSNSVGLKNIFQRVMIFYGGRAGMLIESELDEGTTITIKEPLSRDDS